MEQRGVKGSQCGRLWEDRKWEGRKKWPNSCSGMNNSNIISIRFMKLSSKNGRNMESLLPDRSSALQYISWHGIQAFCGSLLVNCYQLWRIPICAMGCVEPAPFSGGEVSFLQYFNLHRKSAKLRELAMSPRFSFWATRLLGVSKVRLVLRIFFSVWGLEVWWLKIVHNWRCPFSLKPKAFTKMPFLWSVLAACMQNEVGCDVYPSCNDLLQYLCFENLKNPGWHHIDVYR